MHRLLFYYQKYLTPPSIIEYAQKLKLNISQFQADMESYLCRQKVQRDYDSAKINGVEGTPTFFINGKRFEGSWMDEDFQEFLQLFTD